MVAAVKKKNTIEQTGFALVDDGFTYRNKVYRFDDVAETRILRSVFELRTIPVGSDYSHSISIMLCMKSGENLQVSEQPTMTSDSKLSRVEYVERAFETISKMSWDVRARKYVRQIDELGYFDYSGWRFYPKQRKIQHLEKNRNYELNSTELLKSYGFITVKDKNDGLGSKLFKKLVGGEAGIGTLSDSDIFFALLKHYFSLSWES